MQSISGDGFSNDSGDSENFFDIIKQESDGENDKNIKRGEDQKVKLGSILKKFMKDKLKKSKSNTKRSSKKPISSKISSVLNNSVVDVVDLESN